MAVRVEEKKRLFLVRCVNFFLDEGASLSSSISKITQTCLVCFLPDGHRRTRMFLQSMQCVYSYLTLLLICILRQPISVYKPVTFKSVSESTKEILILGLGVKEAAKDWRIFALRLGSHLREVRLSPGELDRLERLHWPDTGLLLRRVRTENTSSHSISTN